MFPGEKGLGELRILLCAPFLPLTASKALSSFQVCWLGAISWAVGACSWLSRAPPGQFFPAPGAASPLGSSDRREHQGSGTCRAASGRARKFFCFPLTPF